MAGRKSLAELAAELGEPIPRDIDPEALDRNRKDSESEDNVDENAGRDHYEAVGKGQLRKPTQVALGPQYDGSKVSRADLDDDDEEEDDPFARRSGSELSPDAEDDNEEYDDPDLVDFGNLDGDDEEIDSDEAFEDGEEEIFRQKGFTFKDSGRSAAELRKMMASVGDEEDEEDDDEQSSDQGESDESSFEAEFDKPQVDEASASDSEAIEYVHTDVDDLSATDESDDDNDAENGQRAAITAMASTGARNAISGVSSMLQSEAKKGSAVKKQYATFDALVGTRVQLQKALIAANSLSIATTSDTSLSSLNKSAEAAEKAAVEVLNSLTTLLHTIQNTSLGPQQAKTVLGKRPFSATIENSSDEIGAALSAHNKIAKARRRSILEKWGNKTRNSSLSLRSHIKERPQKNDLVDDIDKQLSGRDGDRLVQRTRIPRSCAPLQQSNGPNIRAQITYDADNNDGDMGEDVNGSHSHLAVFDDADFYALLLREMIDHKKSYATGPTDALSGASVATATTPNNLLRSSKTKRANVDTKASKGRKMKYTVHAQLQNFMAPVDLGSWERRQAEELFAGLLGKRIARLDEDDDAVEIMGHPEEDVEMQGLRLFHGI